MKGVYSNKKSLFRLGLISLFFLMLEGGGGSQMLNFLEIIANKSEYRAMVDEFDGGSDAELASHVN